MPEADDPASGNIGLWAGEFFASLRSAEHTKRLRRSKTQLFVLRDSGIGYRCYQRYHSYHPFNGNLIIPHAVFTVGVLPQFL